MEFQHHLDHLQKTLVDQILELRSEMIQHEDELTYLWGIAANLPQSYEKFARINITGCYCHLRNTLRENLKAYIFKVMTEINKINEALDYINYEPIEVLKSESTNFKKSVKMMKIEKANKDVQQKQEFLNREFLTTQRCADPHNRLPKRAITAITDDEKIEQIKKVFRNQAKYEDFIQGVDVFK